MQISNDVGLYFPSGKHPENPKFLWICRDLIDFGKEILEWEIRSFSLGISVLGWFLRRKTCQDWDPKVLPCLIFVWGHPDLIPGEKEVGKAGALGDKGLKHSQHPPFPHLSHIPGAGIPQHSWISSLISKTGKLQARKWGWEEAIWAGKSVMMPGSGHGISPFPKCQRVFLQLLVLGGFSILSLPIPFLLGSPSFPHNQTCSDPWQNPGSIPIFLSLLASLWHKQILHLLHPGCWDTTPSRLGKPWPPDPNKRIFFFFCCFKLLVCLSLHIFSAFPNLRWFYSNGQAAFPLTQTPFAYETQKPRNAGCLFDLFSLEEEFNNLAADPKLLHEE